MRAAKLLAIVAAVGLAPVGSALAETAKPEFARPPYAGAYEPKGVDERGLWMELDEVERVFRDSPSVLHDEALRTYVHGVLCKTVGFDRCEAVRVYVLKDQAFNASMAPNGLMAVNTGLLARVHSEGELGAILGHEFAHFELRHTLDGFRKMRTATDVLAWLSLAGAATNQNTVGAQNAVVLGFFSFNRNQEKDADLLGAAYIRSSPYPLVASHIWKRLILENDALREERRLKKIRRLRPGPLDSHPTELQRMTYLYVLEQEDGASRGDDAAIIYREQTARVLPELFAGLIKGNEFAAADYVIRSRGDIVGWDAQLLYSRGELYRQRGNPRDLVTARAFFEKATTMPQAPPEAWRGFGLTSMRLGDATLGRRALTDYLEKSPQAHDAAAIKSLLEN